MGAGKAPRPGALCRHPSSIPQGNGMLWSHCREVEEPGKRPGSLTWSLHLLILSGSPARGHPGGLVLHLRDLHLEAIVPRLATPRPRPTHPTLQSDQQITPAGSPACPVAQEGQGMGSLRLSRLARARSTQLNHQCPNPSVQCPGQCNHSWSELPCSVVWVLF